MKAALLLLSLLCSNHNQVVSPFQTPRALPNIKVTPSRTFHAPFHRDRTGPPVSSSSTALFGIPKMFRWLTDQYPNILNRRLGSNRDNIPPIDNFYLDMNGIIHPCTHGNNEQEITLLDETIMFKKIFSYVDRLYKIVKPKKLLYLAVDGVAPRAKMNQQRSRRFRSSKEAEKLAATILARDGSLPEEDAFDSNCITPGTDFMLKLGLAMRKWIEYKQETDVEWRNGCDVVVSGPDVPGEGEHKVSVFRDSSLGCLGDVLFPCSCYEFVHEQFGLSTDNGNRSWTTSAKRAHCTTPKIMQPPIPIGNPI